MPRSDADLENLVVTLDARGWSQRRIGRELDVSRNTVAAILERIEAARTRGHSALPKIVRRRSQLDEHGAFVAELLERHPDLTAVRLHEDLRERGFTGGYTIVKDLLRAARPVPKRDPVERFETDPGAQGQQDWSPYTIDFTEAGRQQVHAFSFILGFSRRQFVRWGPRTEFYTLIRGHQRVAERFGGMPGEVLYDNQAAIVLRREAGRPIYQPRFLVFATHYGFRPHVLPPRSPKLKGKVEEPFQYVSSNLLNGRTFRDLAHLNEVTAWWLDNRSDTHRHDTTRERPIDRFERERHLLRPLPVQPFDSAEVGYRVVSDAGFVEWDATPYAVPYEHVLDLVVVRATEAEIIVYGPDLAEVARHERLPRGYRDPVGASRYHPPKRARRDVDVLIARVGELGEAGAAFAAGVGRAQRYHAQHLVEILQLRERFDADDLLGALDRAVRYRAFDARTVARILEASANPRPLPDTLDEQARRRLREDLVDTHVEPRPLRQFTAAMRGEEDDG